MSPPGVRRRNALVALLAGAALPRAGGAQPRIAYDDSLEALINPWRGETVFQAGQVLSPLQIAVEAARLAYLPIEKSTDEARRLRKALGFVGFGAVQSFFDFTTGSQAYGAINAAERTALVAFRGTEPRAPQDLLIDVDARLVAWKGAANVHAGFATAARALMPKVAAWLNGPARKRQRLLLTGHSLGASLATLAATEFGPTELITIGSPQVGDREFAQSLVGVACTRIVNCLDGVTDLPLPIDTALYQHVGKRLYITRGGTAVESPSDAFVADDRRAAGPADLLALLGKLPRQLTDHSPINYVRAFF